MKFLLLFSILVGGSAQAYELMTLKAFLKAELGGLKLSKEDFKLSADQIKALQNVAPDASETSFSFYYGRNEASELQKACLSVPQKGKEGPMVLGVCFDAKGLLSQVSILNHVEEKGRGIEEESFLKQFKGKSSKDAFALGKDVSGISGATWSSKAVSEALRKASFAFKTFVGKK